MIALAQLPDVGLGAGIVACAVKGKQQQTCGVNEAAGLLVGIAQALVAGYGPERVRLKELAMLGVVGAQQVVVPAGGRVMVLPRGTQVEGDAVGLGLPPGGIPCRPDGVALGVGDGVRRSGQIGMYEMQCAVR